MDLSPAHTPVTEVCEMSWTTEELFYKLDEEIFAGLQSLLVLSSFKSSSSSLVKPISKLSSLPLH